jgi:hypothetical protein
MQIIVIIACVFTLLRSLFLALILACELDSLIMNFLGACWSGIALISPKREQSLC